jgi:hypothetical protein
LPQSSAPHLQGFLSAESASAFDETLFAPNDGGGGSLLVVRASAAGALQSTLAFESDAATGTLFIGQPVRFGSAMYIPLALGQPYRHVALMRLVYSE